METLISVALISILNIVCFVIGARVGQKVVNKEPIKVMPNPVQAIKEHQERTEYDKEQEKFKVMSENIDNYDGTPYGQKELPR